MSDVRREVHGQALDAPETWAARLDRKSAYEPGHTETNELRIVVTSREISVSVVELSVQAIENEISLQLLADRKVAAHSFGIVLTPTDAHQLGVRLLDLADLAESPDV